MDSILLTLQHAFASALQELSSTRFMSNIFNLAEFFLVCLHEPNVICDILMQMSFAKLYKYLATMFVTNPFIYPEKIFQTWMNFWIKIKGKTFEFNKG